MMKAKTPLLVGLVVLIGAGAFVFTFGSLDQGMNLDKSYGVDAVFEDATGLVVQSRVMMSGIPVGEIVSVDLDPDDQSRALVRMRVAPDIVLYEGVQDPATGLWKNGASAARLQASLLGDYYVSLTPGVAGSKLSNGSRIRIVQTESGLGAVLDQLEESSKTILPNLERITADIAEVTASLREAVGSEEGLAALEEIRDNVRLTTREIASLSTEVRAFVNEDIIAEGDKVGVILDNVAATTASLQQTAERADRQVASILGRVDGLTADLRVFLGQQLREPGEALEGTITSAIKKADDAIASADRSIGVLEGTLENARSVSAKIDQGEGTVGRLINDTRLIDDLEGVVGDIGTFTSTLAQLQIEVDFRTEYLFLQNSLRNTVSIKLKPKPDKYYFFQIVDDPRGNRTFTQRVTTSNDPTKPPVLVEDIVLTEDSLKITAQMAKRWHFLTFRYGIMESTGGWGLDLELLNDALAFKLDVFEFGRNDWPRVRLAATYEFVRHIYVSAGVDDMLNGDSREYYFGAGVRFTDEDLLGLLPFLPTP